MGSEGSRVVGELRENLDVLDCDFSSSWILQLTAFYCHWIAIIVCFVLDHVELSVSPCNLGFVASDCWSFVLFLFFFIFFWWYEVFSFKKFLAIWFHGRLIFGGSASSSLILNSMFFISIFATYDFPYYSFLWELLCDCFTRWIVYHLVRFVV